MSLFDSLLKGAAEQLLSGGDAKNNNLLGAAAKLINSPEVGGLAGLARLFDQKGQGDAINSWIGTGKNQPISPEAILKVFGAGRIHELAGSLGQSDTDVGKGLASALPQLVDKLTPDGKLPAGDNANELLGQLARKFLGG